MPRAPLTHYFVYVGNVPCRLDGRVFLPQVKGSDPPFCLRISDFRGRNAAFLSVRRKIASCQAELRRRLRRAGKPLRRLPEYRIVGRSILTPEEVAASLEQQTGWEAKVFRRLSPSATATQKIEAISRDCNRVLGHVTSAVKQVRKAVRESQHYWLTGDEAA
ncbi:hypothetical protein OPIT5_00065 (plasmid) [Opitutaceae bacterium TAV5]|nr:hypothetical protein OPIT5_00065 [Opitutaceae bacterium TAV5]